MGCYKYGQVYEKESKCHQDDKNRGPWSRFSLCTSLNTSRGNFGNSAETPSLKKLESRTLTQPRNQ